jgi:RNA polymerase sigma-B factor
VVIGGVTHDGERRRETATLLGAYHGRGDRRARARVIEANMPLVRSIARRFCRAPESFEDLVQVGAIGLIKAVDGYRVERGHDLGAYAVPTIVGELRRHVGARRWPVHVAGRRGADTAPVAVSLDDAAVADGASEVDLEHSEARDLVRAGLLALPPRDRRIVALRFYSDLSQERIAAEVGLSQVQVSRVLASSLERMRDTIEAS